MTSYLSRRALFGGLAAILAAPAIVKAEAIMRISPPFLWGDGIHDDTQAIQDMIDRFARENAGNADRLLFMFPVGKRLRLAKQICICRSLGGISGAMEHKTLLVSTDESACLRFAVEPGLDGTDLPYLVTNFHVTGGIIPTQSLSNAD